MVGWKTWVSPMDSGNSLHYYPLIASEADREPKATLWAHSRSKFKSQIYSSVSLPLGYPKTKTGCLPDPIYASLGFHFSVSKQHEHLIQGHQTLCMEFLQSQPQVLSGYLPVKREEGRMLNLLPVLLHFQPPISNLQKKKIKLVVFILNI